eukprot:1538994-Pyramimonas_sp.AAC.1
MAPDRAPRGGRERSPAAAARKGSGRGRWRRRRNKRNIWRQRMGRRMALFPKGPISVYLLMGTIGKTRARPRAPVVYTRREEESAFLTLVCLLLRFPHHAFAGPSDRCRRAAASTEHAWHIALVTHMCNKMIVAFCAQEYGQKYTPEQAEYHMGQARIPLGER